MCIQLHTVHTRFSMPWCVLHGKLSSCRVNLTVQAAGNRHPLQLTQMDIPAGKARKTVLLAIAQRQQQCYNCISSYNAPLISLMVTAVGDTHCRRCSKAIRYAHQHSMQCRPQWLATIRMGKLCVDQGTLSACLLQDAVRATQLATRTGSRPLAHFRTRMMHWDCGSTRQWPALS